MLKKKFFKTKSEAEVTFEFARKDIKSVALAGEFNEWSPLKMNYIKKDKVFRAKVRLPKNATYRFKYLLDNEIWENDYKADAYVPNTFGSEDSVVTTEKIA
ncbi:1,4-alpha-glucan branching protein [Endozoicomonas sp. (ex Bugula neritina AB1)]|nr:1,4-alpha-glucan branching protein [Endozoicomonas sp. (ex Bugula neritina AB1)]